MKSIGFWKIPDNVSAKMMRFKDERVKQLIIGVGILITLAAAVPFALVGWRFLPGLLGEWVGTVIGILTTPFFMEASFAILGLVMVISLNQWRSHKEGDELVYLDQVAGPDLPRDLPAHATWALYLEKPLESTTPSKREQAEGALAIGDHAAAIEWISAMEQDELKQPEILQLRLELARATGRDDLVASLENELLRSKRVADLNL